MYTKELKNYSQPYLYRTNNSLNMLCCYAEKSIVDKFNNEEYTIKPWKIHKIDDVLNNQKSSRLDLPEYIRGYGRVLVECNPCVYSDSSIMTYTCGFKKHPKSAVLYYVVSIDSAYKNIKILRRTFNGILHKGLLYCTSFENHGKNIDIIDIDTNTRISTHKIVDDSSSILRISKIFDSDDFIITSSSKDQNRSMLVNENLELKKEFPGLYKCSLCDEYLAHTLTEPETEKRAINIIKF